MADPTAHNLGTLDEAIRVRAWWLVYAARVTGYPVVITSARRTLTQQENLVREGRSATLKSKHLLGLAFDIDWYGWNRDNVPEQFWHIIGPWAEQNLGLRWGGRFTAIRDYGHFEA